MWRCRPVNYTKLSLYIQPLIFHINPDNFFHFHRRNLDYFLSCLQSAVNSVDPETGGGELVIRIPKEVSACANGMKMDLIVVLVLGPISRKSQKFLGDINPFISSLETHFN